MARVDNHRLEGRCGIWKAEENWKTTDRPKDDHTSTIFALVRRGTVQTSRSFTACSYSQEQGDAVGLNLLKLRK
jgi:hypothetical protein